MSSRVGCGLAASKQARASLARCVGARHPRLHQYQDPPHGPGVKMSAPRFLWAVLLQTLVVLGQVQPVLGQRLTHSYKTPAAAKYGLVSESITHSGSAWPAKDNGCHLYSHGKPVCGIAQRYRALNCSHSGSCFWWRHPHNTAAVCLWTVATVLCVGFLERMLRRGTSQSAEPIGD